MEDIQLIAEFDGFIQSPTNEYLWRKQVMVNLGLIDDFRPTADVKSPAAKWVDVSKGGIRLSSMRYKESFDWLIPVIKKCKIIGEDKSIKSKGYHFDILYGVILDSLQTLDSGKVYTSVLYFIKNYIKYQKTND